MVNAAAVMLCSCIIALMSINFYLGTKAAHTKKWRDRAFKTMDNYNRCVNDIKKHEPLYERKYFN